MDEQDHTLTGLSAPEIRVLGCLVEKEATTPDNYPLTLNSLRNACNQSTSRDPVVSYGDREIEQALASLRERGLTRTVHSTSNRATKFRHVVPETFELDHGHTAVLAVLLLRGPQTVGELKTRSDRQHHFEATDDVAAVLRGLAERGLAVQLERRPGQKDARWAHLLGDTDAVLGDGEGEPSAVSTAGAPSATAADPADPYGEATAEFYDLLAAGHWEVFGLELLDALADVDPAAGPLVDIGAGTGVGLPYLHAAVPAASIWAIEPSRAMRTALHTRLSIETDLQAVTTVVPDPLATADLPETACAIVVSAALGHLTADERGRLWRYVRDRTPPGAPAVVELLPPHEPTAIPPTRYRALPVGEFVYEGWQEAEPLDDRRMAWTMTYRVLRGDDLVGEHVVRSSWQCFGIDEVRGEIEPLGLTLEPFGEAVVVRHR